MGEGGEGERETWEMGGWEWGLCCRGPGYRVWVVQGGWRVRVEGCVWGVTGRGGPGLSSGPSCVFCPAAAVTVTATIGLTTPLLSLSQQKVFSSQLLATVISTHRRH